MDKCNGAGNPIIIEDKMDRLITASMMPHELYHSLPPMPWFGMDIGGTLTKLVYFEPTDLNDISSLNNGLKRNKTDLKTITNIRRYLLTNKAYGTSGQRDDHLQMSNVHIGGRLGTLHFIRFPTSQVRMTFIQGVQTSLGYAKYSFLKLRKVCERSELCL